MKVFLIYSPRNIAFCTSTQDVARALINRTDDDCIIYIGENYDDLQQCYAILMSRSLNQNVDQSKKLEYLALPNKITEPTFLTYAPNNLPMVMRKYQEDDWAISALNGFCTATSTIELCKLFEASDLIYPIATWTPNHESAISLARNNYVNRFCQRYNPQYERLCLPQTRLEYFQDKYFYEREKRLQARIEEVKKWQYTMFCYGW